MAAQVAARRLLACMMFPCAAATAGTSLTCSITEPPCSPACAPVSCAPPAICGWGGRGKPGWEHRQGRLGAHGALRCRAAAASASAAHLRRLVLGALPRLAGLLACRSLQVQVHRGHRADAMPACCAPQSAAPIARHRLAAAAGLTMVSEMRSVMGFCCSAMGASGGGWVGGGPAARWAS